MKADLRKKAKIIFKNIFESWWIVVTLDRHCLKKKMKSNWIIKDELSGQIMK